MTYDLVVGGDFYVGNHAKGRLVDLLLKNDPRILGDLKGVFKDSVVSLINLEGPILAAESIKRNFKTGPQLSMLPENLHYLERSGIDALTLANNHIMDHGTSGLRETMGHIGKYKFKSVGAGISEKEAKEPLILSFNDQKVGIINFAENEWIRGENGEELVNSFDTIKAYQQVLAIVDKVNHVILVYHGGLEYYKYPTPEIKKLFHFFLDIGVDCVISHHTHTYSGVEKYNGKTIYYGIGNLVFDSQKINRGVNWNIGMCVWFRFRSGIMETDYIPFEQHNESLGVHILTGSRKTEFERELGYLNGVIENDILLLEKFNELLDRVSLKYRSFLNPYQGIFSSLYKRRLLPELIRTKHALLLLNLVRCETHRSMVLGTLSKQVRSDRRLNK